MPAGLISLDKLLLQLIYSCMHLALFHTYWRYAILHLGFALNAGERHGRQSQHHRGNGSTAPTSILHRPTVHRIATVLKKRTDPYTRRLLSNGGIVDLEASRLQASASRFPKRKARCLLTEGPASIHDHFTTVGESRSPRAANDHNPCRYRTHHCTAV